MRKEFAAWMAVYGNTHTCSIFLAGDLGYLALESVREAMNNRFINVGVSEQNMISVAAGFAQQGLSPFCYSIAPFLVFRPFEQIRLDVCLHNLDVKLIGNGGGYGYGIMGATHHAIEDLAALSALQNMRCYIPFCNEDVPTVCAAMVERTGPAYLRLGYGNSRQNLSLSQPYAPVRQLRAGTSLTIVGCGPVLLNAVDASALTTITADIFAVSELPVTEWFPIGESIKRTGHLLIVEEHVRRGGLGEALAIWMIEQGMAAKVIHRYATGYPNGRYGSQSYHQQLCGLDTATLQKSIQDLFHA
ncbi:MAG: transketolase C-terminal domain-containing protein [Deltaproteobacteria bacterium]